MVESMRRPFEQSYDPWMAVERRKVEFFKFLRMRDRTCVRRWGTDGVHMSAEAHVSIGWCPDGSWWVDDTREQWGGWLFTAPNSAEARAAAQALADEKMAEPPTYLTQVGRWVPAIANHAYDPGSQVPREADVPEWPPGFDPGD
jgi:hypothetical protein